MRSLVAAVLLHHANGSKEADTGEPSGRFEQVSIFGKLIGSNLISISCINI